MEDAPVSIVTVKKAQSMIDQAGPECERDEKMPQAAPLQPAIDRSISLANP
jgi:hypothetical protein